MDPRSEDLLVENVPQDMEMGDSVLESISPTVWTIHVRSTKLPNGQIDVPTTPESDLSTLVSFVNEVLGGANGASLNYTKILVKGKVLPLDTPVNERLKDGDTVMLIFSTQKEIDAMRAAEQVDNRIRSFEEEEELQRKRRERSSAAYNSYWGEEQDSTYKFVKIEVCSRFVTPHPFEAERLLIKLATDPGIKKIMRKYKWTVGTLAEMDPKSDMISLRKEQDGVCVLGYNENAGHKIFLRLRTDDELEFRGYDGLVNTLLHELTHNVRGPHDEEFWKIFGQLKAEYLKFHETEYKQGSTKARRIINSEARVSREIRNQAGNSALSESERRAAQSVVSRPVEERPSAYIPMRLGATHSRARQEERERLAKAAEARLASNNKNNNQNDNKCCDGDHDHHAHFANKVAPPPKSSSDESEHSVESKMDVEDAKVQSTGSNEASKHEQDKMEMEQVISPTAVEQEHSSKMSNEAKQEEEPQQQKPPEPVVPKVFVEPSPFGMDEENTSDREKRVRQAIIQLCRMRNEEGAKLTYLIIKNALKKDAKFKHVKMTSERFQKHVSSTPAFLLLESVGFERKDDHLVLTRDDPGLLILARMLLEESQLVTIE